MLYAAIVVSKFVHELHFFNCCYNSIFFSVIILTAAYSQNSFAQNSSWIRFFEILEAVYSFLSVSTKKSEVSIEHSGASLSWDFQQCDGKLFIFC